MTCRSNNYSSVIFIPENICENGLLCGEVSVDDLLKTKNYFIHNVVEDLSIVPHNVIGVVGNIPLGKRRYKKHNWIRLKVYDKIPLAFEVLSDNVVVKRGDYQIIMYNQPCFLQSELLLALDCNDETPKEFTDDHFKQLLRSLNHKEIKDTSNSVQPFIHFILLQLLDILRLIVRFLDRLTFFLKFSTLAIYITTFIKNAVWILELMNQSEHSVKLKIGNYIFSLIADWLGGLVIIYWFMSLVSITEVLSLLSTQSEVAEGWQGWQKAAVEEMREAAAEEANLARVYDEVDRDGVPLLAVVADASWAKRSYRCNYNSSSGVDVVSALKDMVRYLMGSPADLKLNSPLNNVLGKFFLFHIDLWWAFFGYSRPLLEVGLRMFVFLGSLGLSFQLAILADLLAVATFHVYVIYVYAARLYHAQLMALASLSRVFLGRKRNPVPGRVDSCPYSTEQLLVGTIAFTVLLFLLPTTLVYYIVFTAMRVLLVAAGGLLTRARFVLAVLPLYSSTLWLVDSPTTTSCVRLSPEQVGGELVLCARPVQDTWWRTVLRCLPAHVAPPPPLHWSDLAWSLVTGRLVYPL